jgi:hypothetical protein
MFVVQVCGQVFHRKTNFEFTFPKRPSLQELAKTTESSFSTEISVRRPEGVPQHSFHVAKLKVYDDNRNIWVDLLSESQLVDYCQVYASQPQNPWHKEVPQESIPAAVKPPTAQSTNVSTTPITYSRPAVAAYSGSHLNRSAQGQPGAGAIAIRPTAQMPVRPSVDATQEEKLRVVFAEFDVKGHRMLEMEDLKHGFRVLGFEFTTATMKDLFMKGDLNADGRISFSEFERFAKMYPIMTDCLFFRSKAFWDEDNMQRELDAEKEAARQADAEVQQAAHAHQQALRAADDAANEIMAAEGDIKDLNNRLRDITKDADHAQREKERAQKEKYDRENDVAQVKDKERQARQVAADAARDADKADRKVQAHNIEAAKADDKVKQLQQALEDAKRGADRAHQQARQAQGEADTLKNREKDGQKALDAIMRELPRLEEALKNADLNTNNANDHIRDLDDLARDVARDIDEAARRRDANERAAQAAKDHEAQISADVERARQRADDLDRQAKAKEAELQEQQRQRQMVSQHERALIEQELRLREQRDTLEEKETKLKSEAGSFLAGLRTTLQSGPRSYSRDPSSAGADHRRNAGGY